METQVRRKEDITLNELDARIAAILEVKADEEAKEAEVKVLSERRIELERELATLLEIMELDTVTTASGTFNITTKSGFKMPADDEARAKLFQYMKDRGIYDSFITVNSQKLNSWANEEEKVAEKEGNFDFQIPGLTRGEPYKVYKAVRNKPKGKK